MTTTQILDHFFPFTIEDRRCNAKKQDKLAQRYKLAQMIERWKAGEAVSFEELGISENCILKLIQD